MLSLFSLMKCYTQTSSFENNLYVGFFKNSINLVVRKRKVQSVLLVEQGG